MKILVTGAGGYLGQGIIKILSDFGNDVIATDLFFANRNLNVKYKEVDLFSINNPYEYFEKPDCLLHLAWIDGFKHNTVTHLKQLPNHYEFLVRMMDSGLEHLSIMGTMHEVGYYEGMVSENTTTNPINLYGLAKESLRKSIHIYINTMLKSKHKPKFQWLRAYYIIGNTDKGQSIFSKLYALKENGHTDFPFTTGENKYDFLDYDLFCSYVAKTVLQQHTCGVIEICSGEPVSLKNKVLEFINKNNLDIHLQYGAFPDRMYDSKEIWGDKTKLNIILDNYKKANHKKEQKNDI